jgi:thiol-disulfide isomerase/thioredoxin
VPSSSAAGLKAFRAQAKDILGGIDPKTASVDIECAVSVGADYQIIENVVDVWTMEEKSIPHKQGQVLLIDFWATWCPPCQKPMAHN